jgi:hypothetical protein
MDLGRGNPASSNDMCVAIFIFLVTLSQKYILFCVAVYPKNIPVAVCESNFAGRCPGSLMTAGQPKMQMDFALGLTPVYACMDVVPIAR